MWHRIALALVGSLLALAAAAQTVNCPDAPVRVTGDDPGLTQRSCVTAGRMQKLLRNCELPGFDASIDIEIVEDIDAPCLARFHCGEARIEILSLAEMERRWNPLGAFGFLDVEAYFHSVLVHEMAHAIYDLVPCPVEDCVASTEYLAYALQVLSLDLDARQIFADRAGIVAPITGDELNAILLYVAPERFAQKVWAHLNQQEDRCAYLGRIARGEVFFDFDPP